ncbi:RNA polymerase sigma factor [Paraflavitalea speifideaquila]|uniref:RNA polymerase sigma factor n=1 Tax=Paraflavitalea speifideaquila TaxID=3076558 RepID=UPI0028EAD11A|nr:sigma-70 family RNA polymerase sigma factor [Paraflavitalea speifideiaquila]
MTSLAKSIVQNEAQAEDIIMDVLCTYWEKRGDFHQVRDVKAYLYVTVRNRCYDYFRHQQVIKAAGPQLEYLFQPTDEISSFEEMQAEVTVAETIVQLYQAIEGLPEKYRRILELQYFENKSITEIGDILAKPYQTVVTQRLRALSRLKIKLHHTRASAFLPLIYCAVHS